MPPISCVLPFNAATTALKHSRINRNPGGIVRWWTLLGQQEQACRDVEQAIALMDDRADPMLRHELTVRQATCKQRRTINGKD